MQEIATSEAPASIGPFSQGIRDGNRVYVSGQGPVDPGTGKIVSEDVPEQTAQTLDNIEAVLEAAGTTLDRVVKTTVFVKEMENYDAVNEVYEEYMTEPFPARSAIEVAELPIDIEVEIEAIATV